MAASSLYILYKTPLGKTGSISNSYFYLMVAYASSFLISPDTVSQATYGYLPPTVQHLSDLWDIMPHHWLPGASHPNPYLGRRRISLEVAIILSKFLQSRTQLNCNQFVIHLKFVFIHANIVKILLVMKTLIKNYEHFSSVKFLA